HPLPPCPPSTGGWPPRPSWVRKGRSAPAGLLAGGLLLRALPLLPLFLEEPGGDVVLEDVAHVLARLAADPVRRHPLDVVEPHVRVQPRLRRLLPEPRD